MTTKRTSKKTKRRKLWSGWVVLSATSCIACESRLDAVLMMQRGDRIIRVREVGR
jgi:hypothetical protein